MPKSAYEIRLSLVGSEMSIRARLRTAYPRRSKTFEDPGAGLASVEALFAAMALLGQPRPDLLDEYHWRERFLELNPGLSAS